MKSASLPALVACLLLSACRPGEAPHSPSLNDPTGLAFDASGNLWAANYRGNSLLMYSREQLVNGGSVAPVRSISGPHTGLRGPNRLAFDRTGSLWTVNYDADAITAYRESALTTGGDVVPQVTIRADSIDQPTGLAFDRSGDLWVTNQGNGSIVSIPAAELSGDGTVMPGVVLGMPQGKGSVPEAVAFAPDGSMWIALYGEDRVVSFHARTMSPAQIAVDRPIGLVFDSQGRLWVTEASAVRRFDLSHLSSPTTTVSWESMPPPHTPALDQAGNLWFSCQNNTVVRFSVAQLSSVTARTPSAVIA